MSNTPLVSILMNCYNSEKFLEETLQSLVRQTYTNWQLAFVDNCSTDKSKEILNKFCPDSRIVYLSTPHHMPLGEARELGLESCSGDFICFLDTDDLWKPDKIEKQLDFFLKHKEVMLCYSSYFFIDENSKIIGRQDLKFRYGDLFGYNLARYEINFQTVMIRQEALKQVDRPYFEPTLKYSPDHNLMMRLLAYHPAACLKEKLAYYRKSSNSLTQKSVNLWGIESEFTYKQLDALGLVVPKSTVKQRWLALGIIAYYKAAGMMSNNDCKGAVEVLRKYRFINHKFYIVYLAARYRFIWNLLHRLKEKMG